MSAFCVATLPLRAHHVAAPRHRGQQARPRPALDIRVAPWQHSGESCSCRQGAGGTAMPSCMAAAAASRPRDLSCRAADTETHMETHGRVADEDYMQEYAQLKSSLLENTRKSGAGVAAYLLFTVNGTAALCALVGMGFSNVYLQWLFRDVDNVKPTDHVPMMAAKQIESPVRRVLAMWLTSYYHALRPRLVVPIALAALMAAYNSVAEQPLSGLEETGLLLGFLSHKVALILKVADEVSPKGYMQETSRPRIEKLEDEDEVQLDRWARPMKAQYKMPTEALPEDVDTNNLGLLPSLLVKGAESLSTEDDEPAGSERRP